jgi:hypothetical protein
MPIEEHAQESTVVSSLQQFTICELAKPQGWPDEVCTYARSLDDVAANVGKIPSQRAEPNASIRRLMVEDAYVEVKPVPEDHPLAGLPILHRGVFAVRDIPAQTCLFEYTGELVQRYTHARICHHVHALSDERDCWGRRQSGSDWAPSTVLHAVQRHARC